MVTQGLVRPPFSNSWALIFLTGVAPPDPVDLEPVERDLEYLLVRLLVAGQEGVVDLVWGVDDPDLGEMGRQWPGGRLWATSQLSIICLLAFLIR